MVKHKCLSESNACKSNSSFHSSPPRYRLKNTKIHVPENIPLFFPNINKYLFIIPGIPTDSSMLGQPILVCTAHIHWDPEFCDVKLIQTMMLSNELRSILDDSARTLRLAGQRDNVQLLLCGDFNSLPDSGEYCRKTIVLRETG